MNRLSELLSKRLETEGLSVRDAGQLIGVSHSTVARAVNGETVEVDTLVKIANFLGVPVKNILEPKDDPDAILEQVMMVISIEPELSRVFSEIAQKIVDKQLDKKVLSEVAAFAAYRLQLSSQSSNVAAEERVKAE